MRLLGPTMRALVVTLALGVTPALALDRPANPADGSGVITRVADLDRPARAYRQHGPRHYRYWRYRAAYTRWLHNEYVVAGYPVHQYRTPTYFWVYDRCHCHRW